ncbi:MAG TPA: hypothetical protein VMF30_15495 [Pirellulales bacterium]|nr:hypothetical protein [Pirellulales bacterium]
MAGENLDMTSDAGRRPAVDRPGSRPFVGVRFACCDVYNRVYVNPAGTEYRGACPRCGRGIRLRIAPHGTDSRFFTAF